MTNHFKRTLLFWLITFLFALTACDSGTKDLIDLAIDKPSRKPIDVGKMGVNNFFVDSQFGTISAQYSEIKGTLGLKYVRVLFAWSDQVQPTPSSPLDFSFYDAIINSIPAGVDVLIVVAHTPAWMSSSSNWISGDPRTTWVERWLKPTLQRYANKPGIIGWEVFNEPNVLTVASDNSLGISTASNYYDLLQKSSAAIRSIDPTSLVVIAATTSIQQNYPHALDFNKQLQELGAEDLVDVWNIHYYGEQFEKVVEKDGVANFLNSINKPIWMTESGIQGSSQLAYVETTWPFLQEKIPGIERIYYYEYGDTVPVSQNYGLKTTDPQFPVSDLYIYLRDN